MKTVELAWYPRVTIWLRVGNTQAPNMQVASALYRVIEKVRPTEKEREETQLTSVDNGYRWLLPHFDYGRKTIEFEDEEAEQLAAVLESLPPGAAVLVADMEWLMPLIERLKAKQEFVPAAT